MSWRSSAPPTATSRWRHHRSLVGDVNYWISGEDPALVPVDYFEPGAYASQLAFQEAKITAHLARYDDVYVPFLFPWYGTVVVPSALGCAIEIPPGEEPAVAGPAITEPSGGRPPRAARPRARRPHAPRARLHRPLPRAFRPACQLHGQPGSPEHRPQPGRPRASRHLDGGGARCRPRAHGLLHDRAHRLGPPTEGTRRCAHRRRGVPALHALAPGASAASGSPTTTAPSSRRGSTGSSWCPTTVASFSAFGGGSLHYCGDGGHQLENFLATDGLVGINVWCMGHFGQSGTRPGALRRPRHHHGRRLHAPRAGDVLRRSLRRARPAGSHRGHVPLPLDRPRYGTGQVEAVRRDAAETGRRAWEVMQRLAHAGRPR